MMSGSNPMGLDIYLGKELIGQLSLEHQEIRWHYTQAWQAQGYAISPHLFLHELIPSLNSQIFLRNLLPEGHGLEILLQNFHLSRQNTFGLIRALGLDTSGALIFVPKEQPIPSQTSFRELNKQELTARLDERSARSLIIWDNKPRLSVAGVQDKINIMINSTGELGFGEGGLCSTHILKFEQEQTRNLVLNEYLTMRLASRCGIETANVNLDYYGKHAVLLVERFDRKFISDKQVKRRHIIDGCQALNLPPEYKYERNLGSGRDVRNIREGASFEKLFELTKQCKSPALAKQKIIDWAIFNCLTYNFDAHGKNISFYVSKNGLEITPFYDLVNINMYPEFAHEMAMAFGDEFDGHTVNAYQLADFADSCNLARTLVSNRLENIAGKLTTALTDEINKLSPTESQKAYLKQYKISIETRCEYLLAQAQIINSIEL